MDDNSEILISSDDMDVWTERAIKECVADYPLRKYIRTRKNTCVDAGANVGGFIINYHHLFNQIYAYEASTTNVKRCEKNLQDRNIDNVILRRKAVAEKDGDIVLLKKHSGTENCGCFGVMDVVDKHGDGWNKENGGEEVSTISLEKIVEESGYIDVLKVDIEGAEYNFLFGKDLSQVDFIFMELHNFLMDMNQHSELVGWIKKTHSLWTMFRPEYSGFHQNLVFKKKN